MIAELRARLGQRLDHLVRDMALEFRIFHAARIAKDIEDHLAFGLDVLGDGLEVLAEIVMVRRQAERFG